MSFEENLKIYHKDFYTELFRKNVLKILKK